MPCRLLAQSGRVKGQHGCPLHLGEPAAFACSNRICSLPSFNAEELQATVKQMAKLKPSRAALN